MTAVRDIAPGEEFFRKLNEAALAAVIASRDPDIVVLQEAYSPPVVKQLAATCHFEHWASSQGHSVAFMSRLSIAGHVWRRVRWAKRAYLEIVTSTDFPEGTASETHVGGNAGTFTLTPGVGAHNDTDHFKYSFDSDAYNLTANASSTLNAGKPRGVAMPNWRKISLPWYSWIFIVGGLFHI